MTPGAEWHRVNYVRRYILAAGPRDVRLRVGTRGTFSRTLVEHLLEMRILDIIQLDTQFLPRQCAYATSIKRAGILSKFLRTGRFQLVDIEFSSPSQIPLGSVVKGILPCGGKEPVG